MLLLLTLSQTGNKVNLHPNRNTRIQHEHNIVGVANRAGKSSTAFSVRIEMSNEGIHEDLQFYLMSTFSGVRPWDNRLRVCLVGEF
jgi:hypothetical protein